MTKRIYRKPHRIKRKKSIFKKRFFWLSILFLIFLIGSCYFLFFSNFFEIKKIEISGNEKIKREEIESFLEEKIVSDFRFVKIKNLLFLNIKKLERETLEKFPQMEAILPKKVLPDILRVEIKERKGKAIFKNRENLFLLDEKGIIFEKKEAADNFLIIEKLNLEKEINLGEKVLEEEILNKVFYFDSKMREELKIPLKEAIIVSPERINLKTSENWEIYLNPKDDFDWQFTRLKTILEKKIPKEKRSKLQYVDLRFERVYIFPEILN